MTQAHPKFIAAADFARMAKAGNAPADPLIRVNAFPTLKAINDDARSIDFCISDGSLDRDNDTINVNGWDLNNYLKNPVVLWAHDPTQLPVAKAANTRVSGTDLISTAVFAPPDLSPFADMVFRFYKGGFMNATSVGFKPTEYEFRSSENDWGCDFGKQELLEYSCVPVPANANALMRAKASGIDTLPLVEWLEKALDGEGKLILPRQVAERLRKAAQGSSTTRVHLSKTDQADLAKRNIARADLAQAFPDAKDGEVYGAAATPDLKWTKAGALWEPSDRQDGDTVSDIALSSGVKASAVMKFDPEQPELEEPEKMQTKSLYVKRAVVNGDELHKWMADNGFASACVKESMHVTVMNSEQPVNWDQLPEPQRDPMTIPVSRGMPATLGDKGATVMHCESADLAERHEKFKQFGAQHSNAEYQPHVTLTYKGGSMDLMNCQAFSGEIKLGPEEYEEVNTSGDLPEETALSNTTGQSDNPDDPDADDIDPATGEPVSDQDEANGDKSIVIQFDGQVSAEEFVKILPELKTAVAAARKGENYIVPAGVTLIIGKAGGDWKCGAARDLSVDEDSAWDGGAAEKSIWDACGFDGDKPDGAKARRAFLAYDASAPDKKGSYKLPFAKFEDGKLKAVRAGLHAAASRLSGTDIPEAVKESAQKVLDHYKPKDEGDDGKAVVLRIKDAEPRADTFTIKMQDGSYVKDGLALTAMIDSALARAIDRAKGKVID